MASKVTPSTPGAPSFCLAISYAARRVSTLQTWTEGANRPSQAPRNRQPRYSRREIWPFHSRRKSPRSPDRRPRFCAAVPPGSFPRHLDPKLLITLSFSPSGVLAAGEFTVYKRNCTTALSAHAAKNLILFSHLEGLRHVYQSAAMAALLSTTNLGWSHPTYPL